MTTASRGSRHHSHLLWVIVAILIVLVVACGDDDDEGVVSGDDTRPTDDGEEPPIAGDPFGVEEWILVAATVDGEPLTLLDSHPVTLSVDLAGTVGGTAACNAYFGTLNDGPALFDGFGVTEMACDPPAAMDLESRFLDALGRSTTATRAGDLLVLTGPDVELRFEPIPPIPDAELVGTVWMLDTIITGDAATSILAGTRPQLELGEVEMIAFDGCNTLAGRYELDGDTLRTGSLRATTRGCSEAIAAQASQISAVLVGTPTVAVSGDHLTLQGPDDLALRFVAS